MLFFIVWLDWLRQTTIIYLFRFIVRVKDNSRNWKVEIALKMLFVHYWDAPPLAPNRKSLFTLSLRHYIYSSLYMFHKGMKVRTYTVSHLWEPKYFSIKLLTIMFSVFLFSLSIYEVFICNFEVKIKLTFRIFIIRFRVRVTRETDLILECT